ncbi:MAG: ABC transporter permease [Lysobacterales bacterium]|jgi:ABC-type polysaccharide/polyol phosphate export permease
MKWRHFTYVLVLATRATYLAQEKNSALGLVWHLLNPLVMTAVLFVVFRNAPFRGDNPNYELFILVGVVHFNFFINTTTRSSANFLMSRSLILNTTVPLELLVLRQSSIEGLTLLIEVLLVLVLSAVIGTGLKSALIMYPVVLLGMLALSLGASLFLCALVVFLSDLSYLWNVFGRILFFVTPVFFTPDVVGVGFARLLLALNPLTHLLQLARKTLLYGGHISLGEIGIALVGPALVFALGVFIFRATRARIPDYI